MFFNFYFWYFFIFIFGLSIGSFLNCVIYRLETGGNFLKGRSFCPQCKHKLAWYDLIPVFSFIILKGKCRYCRQKISWQYPLVELATGIIFLLIFNFQFSIFNQFSIFQFLNLIYYWIIFSLLIVIFIYDFKHYIIPDKALFPAIVITFIYRLFAVFGFKNLNLFRNLKLETGSFETIINPFLAGLIAGAFFLFIFLISRGKWLGFGDVKLVFFMGLLLGFPAILTALFLAFFIGAIIGIGLIVYGKKNLKSEVPFGPFLVIGTFFALFFGQNLINWYLNLFIL